MNSFKLLIPFAHTCAASALLIIACNTLSLGVFANLNDASLILMSLAISLPAMVIYLASLVLVCLPFAIKRPGYALTVVVGTLSGAGALLLTGWIWPSIVLLTNFWAAIPYALVNTLLVLVLGNFTGKRRKDSTLWPQFKTNQD